MIIINIYDSFLNDGFRMENKTSRKSFGAYSGLYCDRSKIFSLC